MPTAEWARGVLKGGAYVEFAGKNDRGAPTICPHVAHFAWAYARFRGMIRMGSPLSREGSGMGTGRTHGLAQARPGTASGRCTRASRLLVVRGALPYDARDAIFREEGVA